MPTPKARPELKLLRGVEPRQREVSSPQPALREPAPMPWFTTEQHSIWTEVTAELRDMGTLSNADRYEIAHYVALVSHAEHAIQQLNHTGEYVVHTEKASVVDPLVVALDRMVARAHQIAGHLGLHPAGRASIHGRMQQSKPNTEAAHVNDLYA